MSSRSSSPPRGTRAAGAGGAIASKPITAGAGQRSRSTGRPTPKVPSEPVQRGEREWVSYGSGGKGRGRRCGRQGPLEKSGVEDAVGHHLAALHQAVLFRPVIGDCVVEGPD